MKTKEKSAKSGMSMKAGSAIMRSLFEDQLKDIYWAENKLTRFMPEIVERITSEELINTLERHMELTKKQVEAARESGNLEDEEEEEYEYEDEDEEEDFDEEEEESEGQGRTRRR